METSRAVTAQKAMTRQRNRLILAFCGAGESASQVNTMLIASGIPGIDGRTYAILAAKYGVQARDTRWRASSVRRPEPDLAKLLAFTPPASADTQYSRLERRNMIIAGVAKDIPVADVNRILEQYGHERIADEDYEALRTEHAHTVKVAYKRRRLHDLIADPPAAILGLIDK
jgi:hypothetical protein